MYQKSVAYASLLISLCFILINASTLVSLKIVNIEIDKS